MRLALLADLPDRDEAQEAAREELSRRQYRDAEPPLVQRFLEWLVRELNELLSDASSNVPGGGWGLFALVLLLIGLMALLVVRLRPTRRTGLPSGLFGDAAELSAEEHRALADRAAAVGEFADAVRERLRAVVRELESRGVLDPRPGRTADEVALEAGRAVPGIAGALTEGVRLFDEVWYGGRTADASTYERMVALDVQVTRTRLVPA